MRRFAAYSAVAVLALSLSAGDLDAQRWGVDLHATGAAATQKLAGAELRTGIGGGGTLLYQLQRHLTAYGGWDWVRFHASESFAGSDLDFDETGYTLGLRFEHPLGLQSNFLYRVEAGGTYKHVEIHDARGEPIADSGHEPGFELAGGLLIPVTGSWRLGPTFRFRSLQPAFEVEGITTEGTLQYAALDLGVSYRF